MSKYKADDDCVSTKGVECWDRERREKSAESVKANDILIGLSEVAEC